MPRPKAEFKPKHAFAEFAEALRVRTDQIVATVPAPKVQDVLVVFYTPGEDEEVYCTVIARDDDGIMRQQGESQHQPDFMANLRKAMT